MQTAHGLLERRVSVVDCLRDRLQLRADVARDPCDRPLDHTQAVTAGV